jgi:hypothetical protein
MGVDRVENIEDLLRLLADAGGKLTVGEVEYYPHDAHALSLGLIEIINSGSASALDVTIAITNKGRRLIGLPVITPSPKRSLSTRVREFLRGAISAGNR